MDADGGNPRKFLSLENDFYAAVAWSPAGQRLAYTKQLASRSGGSIETVPARGGKPNVVFSTANLSIGEGPPLLWLRDGRIVFPVDEATLSSTNYWTIHADPQSGEPSGQAVRITNWDGQHTWSASASQDGRRLALIRGHIRDDVEVGELKEGGRRLDSQPKSTGLIRVSSVLIQLYMSVRVERASRLGCQEVIPLISRLGALCWGKHAA